jgi:diguanylate cyclase (GGDEF)-like protein
VGEHAETLPDRVYVELVRSLYASMAPATIMSLAFALAAGLIFLREPRYPILAVGGWGIVVSVLRVGVVRWLQGAALTASLGRSGARRLEFAFSVPYLLFAASLGTFGALAFLTREAELHMLTICLLVGYCAGVATGVGLRPYAAIPSMVAAMGPTVGIAALSGDAVYFGTALIASAFLVGAAHSIVMRYKSVKAEIGKRLSFGSMARRDGLTALPNRLGLREYFDENVVLSAPSDLAAVHYLDLDGFKPVNDRYGHAVGDALLAAVAERLTGAIRNGDLVARIGGDEFAILQFGLHGTGDAELFSRRAGTAMRQPFRIQGHLIRISACIGTAIGEVRGCDLEDMLAEADRELYVAKRAQAEARRVAA